MRKIFLFAAICLGVFSQAAVADQQRFSWHDKGAYIPFQASQLDPRFSYGLYVPRSYDENGTKAYSLIVLVHGTERGPHNYLQENAQFADEQDAILLAPLFPANTHGQKDLENYKLIDYKGTRYDLILLSMIDEVGAKYRLKDNKFYMHGFSGGGHFSHRFFYLHPHRLHAVSIGAPGMITQLNEDADWWVGVKNVYWLFNARLNYGAMKEVNVHMVVGEKDTVEWNVPIEPNSPYYMEGVEGADYSSSGKNRIERLKTLKRQYEANGINVQMDVVPDAGHDESKMFPAVRAFFAQELAR